MARPRCPNCPAPVSPFAAGCALCGTDLEARLPPRRLAVLLFFVPVDFLTVGR